MSDGPEFSREAWFSVKYTLGLDFPNLPYYINGDIKLTESNAILRHLARKYKLYGETEKEQAHVDLLLDVINDVRNAFVNLCYRPDFNDKLRDIYIEQTRAKLKTFENYLGDKQFFIGDKVAVCDFLIYEILDQNRILEPSLLSERPKLTEFIERFEELPAIKAYRNSENFISRPINNKCAQFA
jgi:glutathione S-transferase